MRPKTLLLLVAVAAMALGAALLWRGGFARAGVALGLVEGCVACHGTVTGLDGPHAPAAIGCAACHAGDKGTLDKDRAHARMVLVPGNLADAGRTCGQSGCHQAIVPRVERSIMATMAGVIAVDRAALGEPATEGDALPHAGRLGHGVADSHLRELCVGCHLGQAKTDWGPVGEESQGGGCNACHLEYGAEAAQAVSRYVAIPRKDRTAIPAAHPSFTVNPRNGHCFGCHSRSGRIALGYEGWHEMHTPDGKAPPGAGTPGVRKLDDGRFVEKIVPDIHHERGMECIDCHNANEVMGAGAEVARKSQQLRIGCEDCHARKHASVAAQSLDPESRTLMALRKWKLAPGERMGTTRDGDPLVNVVVEEGKGARLVRKRTGESLPLKPPLAVCTEGRGHERLSCASCHSAWAPRCTACHTTFDPAGEGFDHAAQAWVKGTWNETAGPFEAALPTLGVVSEGKARGTIDTFVPGMVMSFDRNKEAGSLPTSSSAGSTPSSSRTRSGASRAPAGPATTTPWRWASARASLRYEVSGKAGRWKFTPEHEALAARRPARGCVDRVPEGARPAWSRRARARGRSRSTSSGASCTVGACLTCHAGDSAPMKQSVSDFAGTLARRSPRCVLPAWPREQGAGR